MDVALGGSLGPDWWHTRTRQGCALASVVSSLPPLLHTLVLCSKSAKKLFHTRMVTDICTSNDTQVTKCHQISGGCEGCHFLLEAGGAHSNLSHSPNLYPLREGEPLSRFLILIPIKAVRHPYLGWMLQGGAAHAGQEWGHPAGSSASWPAQSSWALAPCGNPV